MLPLHIKCFVKFVFLVDNIFFRSNVSPVEVERKKRQLELSHRFPRHKRQAEESVEENERNRRQTTDPDQLCPTVASFVMPQAGLNAQGKE